MGLKFVSKVTSNGRHDRTALGRIQDAALVYRGAGERHRQALVHLLPRAAETSDRFAATILTFSYQDKLGCPAWNKNLVSYMPLAIYRCAAQTNGSAAAQLSKGFCFGTLPCPSNCCVHRLRQAPALRRLPQEPCLRALPQWTPRWRTRRSSRRRRRRTLP